MRRPRLFALVMMLIPGTAETATSTSATFMCTLRCPWTPTSSAPASLLNRRAGSPTTVTFTRRFAK